MRSWTFAAVLAATLTYSAPAAAQDSGAGAHPRSEGGGSGMMHRPGRMSFDPVVLNGPPNPDEFARITGLEDSKRDRYAELYQKFIANTQSERDSLKASFAGMRESFQKGDRDQARGQRTAVRDLRDRLVEQQKSFDDTVKELVSHDQWSKYQRWREDERARLRKEWRERRGRPA